MRQSTASTLGTTVTFQCRVHTWPMRTLILLWLVDLASLKGLMVRSSCIKLCSPLNYSTHFILRASRTCLRSFFPSLLSPAQLLSPAHLPRPVNHMLLLLALLTEEQWGSTFFFCFFFKEETRIQFLRCSSCCFLVRIRVLFRQFT